MERSEEEGWRESQGGGAVREGRGGEQGGLRERY